MKRYFSFLFALFLFVSVSATSCVTLSEEQRRDYGVLGSAVTFASDKVIGEYGKTIPDDFTGDKFMLFIEDRIPKDYFQALKKQMIEVKPKSAYYLLIAKDKDNGTIILFDYSCTPQVDGPVLLDTEKYNASKIESFDICRTQELGR